MRRRALLAALALALAAAAPAAADGDRVAATRLPTCSDGEPFLVYIVDASADDDCDSTGGGTTEAPCLCLDGTYVAMLAAGGGGGGYTTCQEEGSSLTQRSTINFVGSSITCADAGGKTVCTLTDATGAIILDLGDDGGNDSTALAELAIGADPYGFISEPSADKALIAPAKVAPYNEYDPDRPPSTCASCEEWTGDTAALSWSWGNQGGTTETLEMDGATIAAPQNTATALRVRCVAAPAATDFTVHALVSGNPTSTFNHFGVALLQGTLATPTRIDSLTPTSIGDSTMDFRAQRYTNYSTYGAGHGDTNEADEASFRSMPVYLRIAFTDSSNAATFSYSFDGYTYIAVASAINIAANPDFVCLELNSEDTVDGVTAHFRWFRIRTDAGRAWPSD